MKKNIKSFDLEDLKEELKSIGEKPFRAEQIFKWLFVEKVKEFEEMTNISKDLRQKLEENYDICNFEIERKLVSKDGTIKYLFNIDGINNVETVLMKYKYGYSVCVSCQIGCKMGCKFCASTGIPFVRSLTPGEIVEQILAIEQDTGNKVSNVVFMGIGEPMDNFENIMKIIAILNNPKGFAIGARHMSVSTSGVVPRIYEFADRNAQSTLAISLHSPNNETRSSMMPVNKAYPIEELMKACKYYMEKTNRRKSFEYALSKGYNDSIEDAENLSQLFHKTLGHLNLVHVNLIPINKIENGVYNQSSIESIMKFRDYLNSKGITATIRRELGSDIEAACGQLRRKNLKN